MKLWISLDSIHFDLLFIFSRPVITRDNAKIYIDAVEIKDMYIIL